jgi:hypothetical protein
MIKKILLFLILIFPLILNAEDISKINDIECDLIHAKNNAQTYVYSYPQAFASVGSPTNSQQTLSIGLSQSLSGLIRSQELNEAANYKCEAIFAAHELDAYFTWAEQDIVQSGAKAELPSIKSTIEKAKINLIDIQNHLEAGTMTIINYRDALKLQQNFEAKQVELETILAVDLHPKSSQNVSELLERYASNFSKSEELLSRADSDKGWDVVASIGSRKIIDNSNQISGSNNDLQSFAALNLQYSLGSFPAKNEVEKVGKNSYELIFREQLGFGYKLDLIRSKLSNLIVVERSRGQFLRKSIESLIKIKESIAKSNSSLSAIVINSIELDISFNKAEFKASEFRRLGFENILYQLDNNNLLNVNKK